MFSLPLPYPHHALSLSGSLSLEAGTKRSRGPFEKEDTKSRVIHAWWVGSRPPGFRQAPFMLLLVVVSLAQVPRSQGACQPSRRLSPGEMAVQAKPAFPVQWRLVTLGRQEPLAHVCVALYTKQEHQRPSPCLPSGGRTTHFPDHPDWATFIPAGASTHHSGQAVGWEEKGKPNCMKSPFS